ncbi:MAG: sulfatase-like hydrolase/transferase [Pirellulales bacterium]
MNRTLVAVLAMMFAFIGYPLKAAERPNVIIIYTDDHGYADLGCQGIVKDIKTPHTDKLAREGVRFTAGYCSAPQCRPSRAGVLTGRYQNRFGLESNNDAGLPWSELTFAERLGEAGYLTGMCGKWHCDRAVGSNGERPDGSMGKRLLKKEGHYKGDRLQNPGEVDRHGFQQYLSGSRSQYLATHDPTGKDLGGKMRYADPRFRIDVQAQWAVSFIRRSANQENPFCLYVGFFAPHVPLEAPDKYLERFPGEMPRRRRLALAMISAVDDGVGLIDQALTKAGTKENTLVFYIGDNGAPLKLDKFDAPGGGPGWDGSLNDPWIGEKGMLTEGGIRVPFVARWPKQFPQNKVYHRPVIALDATATALVAGGVKLDDKIDGVDLVPFLTGKKTGDPHEALYWRWMGQASIRAGDWKYLKAGERAYLFDLSSEQHEKQNLISKHAERAARLKKQLAAWAEQLVDPGLDHPLAGVRMYDHHLDGKVVPRRQPVSTDEPVKRPMRSLDRLFKTRDVNQDGFVTLKEYIGNPVNRNVPALTKQFNKRDANKDGRLTLGEMKSP